MQQVLHIPAGEKEVSCPELPLRVWTLRRAPDDAPPVPPIVPVHRQNAFLENRVHDWNWRGGRLRYFSRLRCETEPVWLLLEYEDQ